MKSWPNFGKYFFSKLAGQHAAFDQGNHFAQVFRFDRESVDFDAFVVEIGRKRRPKASWLQLCITCIFAGSIKVVGHSFGGNDQSCIISRQAIFCHQPLLTLSRKPLAVHF